MSITIDQHGNSHRSAGAPGGTGGQFDQKLNTGPSGGLEATHNQSALTETELIEAARGAERATVHYSSECEWYEIHNGPTPELEQESYDYLRGELDDFANAYPELITAARNAAGDNFAEEFGRRFVIARSVRHIRSFDAWPSLSGTGVADKLIAAVRQRGAKDERVDVHGGEAIIDWASYTTELTADAHDAVAKIRASQAQFGVRVSSNDWKASLGDLYQYLSYTDRRQIEA